MIIDVAPAFNPIDSLVISNKLGSSEFVHASTHTFQITENDVTAARKIGRKYFGETMAYVVEMISMVAPAEPVRMAAMVICKDEEDGMNQKKKKKRRERQGSNKGVKDQREGSRLREKEERRSRQKSKHSDSNYASDRQKVEN